MSKALVDPVIKKCIWDPVNSTKWNNMVKVMLLLSKEDHAMTLSMPYFLSYKDIAKKLDALGTDVEVNLASEMYNEIQAAHAIMTYFYEASKESLQKRCRVMRTLSNSLNTH